VSYEYERVAPAAGLRLHLNENTAGCSPAVVEAVRALGAHDFATYPEYDLAIAACAERLQVEAESLLLTNGLDEGILVAAMVAHRGRVESSQSEGVVVVPAFDQDSRSRCRKYSDHSTTARGSCG
jgi:histidinol-phosphate/aromatic aminotransferase/cobyric acid decarboxylase-like protein